jgi:hypothetical protein
MLTNDDADMNPAYKQQTCHVYQNAGGWLFACAAVIHWRDPYLPCLSSFLFFSFYNSFSYSPNKHL